MRAGSFILPPLEPMDTEIDPKIARSNQPSRTPSRTVKQKSERGRATSHLDRGIADLSNDLATCSNSKRSKSRDSRIETCEGGPELQRGFVLFMPYLHWECQEEVKRHKSILDQKRDHQRGQKASQKMSAEQAISTLNGPEKLLWIYLDEDHPLHIRRTLDQFYYPNSSDIHDRDSDQTALRYFNNQCPKDEGFKPVLTMVDQLWMWVLPKCGVQPPTIITAFPERSNRDQSKWLTALVSNILTKCDDLPSCTCYEVADLIAAECSRIYLDSTSNRKEPIQFLEIYRTSIGNIMGNNAARVGNFLKNIEQLKRPTTDKSNEAKPAEVLEKLLDIKNDIEDLREIKDIQDELSIMIHLFGIQKDTIEEMHKSMHQATRQKNDRTRPDQLNLLPDSYAKAAIKRNVQEVERLEKSAEKAVEAIEKLLELKQKQADLLLTGAIYKINDATDKQGKTLLTFTVVTIIFLPSSFMASFLALNVSQFPWTESINDSKLPLNWVVKTILSVSLPLSIVLLLFAFYLNASLREKHIGFVVRWISLVISWAEKQISSVTSWAEEQILPVKNFVEAAKMLTITGVLIGVYELCKASVDGLRNRERFSGRQDEEVGAITASAPEKGVRDQGSG
ncbi:putative ankyrin repeat protein [Rosellinia necatrix]|uniref:Putative ankyrin repeat protein n=1 Tax=Rosellinia necatrix TaxID=77044 RepID=A0A1S8A7I3_ROSNE|nr:putative ankyrin repeat protein [Rosellinia necatrix]